MEEIKGKKPGRARGRNRRRFWAALGALWLVAACLTGSSLAGCAPSGNSGGETGRQQTVREAETGPEAAAESQPEEAGQASAGDEPDEVERASAGSQPVESEKASAGNQPAEAGQASAGSQSAEAEKSDKTSGEEPSSEADPGKSAGGEVSPEPGERGEPSAEESGEDEPSLTVDESGVYTSKEEVALYIHLYGHLPGNYITKKQAEKLGWDSSTGNLWDVAPGMSIGGSRFGNYEGALPDKKGRTYYECDIDYDGGYRGAKRIIYSDDGLIFYTEDHYKTFEELYGQ